MSPEDLPPVVTPPVQPLMVIDELHVFRGGRRDYVRWPLPVTMTHAGPALAFGRACSPTCHHREFDLTTDQATSTHDAAIAVAAQRARDGRGRQRITRHVSTVWKRGIWFIQDTDAAPPARRISIGFDGSSGGLVGTFAGVQ